jgi:hypothetical protein
VSQHPRVVFLARCVLNLYHECRLELHLLVTEIFVYRFSKIHATPSRPVAYRTRFRELVVDASRELEDLSLEVFRQGFRTAVAVQRLSIGRTRWWNGMAFDLVEGSATLPTIPEGERERVKILPLFQECETPQAIRACGQKERLIRLGLAEEVSSKRAQYGFFGG